MSHYCVCAVQTYWLLLAVSQDQPKNKYVAELRDCCERAALEGSWVCCPPEHMTQSNNYRPVKKNNSSCNARRRILEMSMQAASALKFSAVYCRRLQAHLHLQSCKRSFDHEACSAAEHIATLPKLFMSWPQSQDPEFLLWKCSARLSVKVPYGSMRLYAGSSFQEDKAAAPQPAPQQGMASQLPHQPWLAHSVPVWQIAVRHGP